MKTSIKIGRLRKLISFMEKLPPEKAEHFNMRGWVRHDDTTHKHKAKYVTQRLLNTCGTTACALGWATVIPEFQRAGLRMSPNLDFYVGKSGSILPLDASEQFFGLTNNQHSALFESWVPGEEENPKAWAAKARRLLKEWTGR